MGASNSPTGTPAVFLDTRSSGIHTGNINSNISNGINQHNRSASVMNAQHGYQVEYGGNPITGLACAITSQDGNRVAVQGGKSPLGLGGVGQASSDLASEQDPTPPQPGKHNQPFSTSPPQLSMEYQSQQKRRLGWDRMSHCTCFCLGLLTRIPQLPWCPHSKRMELLFLLLKNLKGKRAYPGECFPLQNLLMPSQGLKR